MNKFAIVRLGQKAKFAAIAATGGLVLAAGPASAAGVDVGAVVSDIAAQAGPIGLIGAAVLLIFVGVKAFKWVRGALS